MQLCCSHANCYKMCAYEASQLSHKVEMQSSEMPICLFCEMTFDPHKTKRCYWLSDMRWHNKCSYAWANIHPSIHPPIQYLHCLSFSGSQGTWAYPIMHFVRGKGRPGDRSAAYHNANTYIHKDTEGQKAGEHANATQKPPRCPRPHCCEATVATTTEDMHVYWQVCTLY